MTLSDVSLRLFVLPTKVLVNFPQYCDMGDLQRDVKNLHKINEIRKRNATPGGIFLFKFNNGNTRTMCEICSKLTIKTPERRD